MRILRKNKIPLQSTKVHLVIITAMMTLASAVIFYVAYINRYAENKSTDAISYMSIAMQYADGHFQEAINAFWSPLISWLMAPFIYFGLDPETAMAVVNSLAAIISMGLLLLFIWRRTNNNILVTAVAWITFIPLFIAAALTPNPDLLVVLSVIMLMVSLYISDAWLNAGGARALIRVVALLSIVGVFGTFAKLFFFPFFVVSIICWGVVRAFVYRPASQKVIGIKTGWSAIKLPLLIFSAMALLLLPWMVVLSMKYDRIMIGSSFGAHMPARLNPEVGRADRSSGTSAEVQYADPDEKPILRSPPNRFAISASEDRTPVPSDSAAQESTPRDISFFISERLRVLPLYLNTVVSMSLFILIAALGLCGAVIYKRVLYKKNNDILIAGVLLMVYFAGYAAITRSMVPGDGGLVRYYWPMFVLAHVIIFVSLPALFNRRLRDQHFFRKAIFIGVVAFIPISSVSANTPEPFKLLQERPRLVYRNIAEQSGIEKGSRVAGNNSSIQSRLAFMLRSQSYGSIGNGFRFENPGVQKALRENKIDYFIHFSPAQSKEKINIESMDVAIINRFVVDNFNCRDVRYGGRGAGVPRETCVIRIIDMNPEGK